MSKKTKLIISIVTFLTVALALSFGYVAGRAYKTYELAKEDKMDHENMTGGAMEHEHISVAPGRLDPKVKLVATKDSMGGYNINVITEAFYFTPQNAGLTPAQNTGHGHLMVNGVKIGRVYGPWLYIGDDKFKSGTNTVTVSLNANNHADWVAKDGKEIEATIEVVK
jgi:hypothetical protein